MKFRHKYVFVSTIVMIVFSTIYNIMHYFNNGSWNTRMIYVILISIIGFAFSGFVINRFIDKFTK